MVGKHVGAAAGAGVVATPSRIPYVLLYLNEHVVCVCTPRGLCAAGPLCDTSFPMAPSRALASCPPPSLRLCSACSRSRSRARSEHDRVESILPHRSRNRAVGEDTTHNTHTLHTHRHRRRYHSTSSLIQPKPSQPKPVLHSVRRFPTPAWPVT